MIGVYGGTFDPIHYGHLRTALEVSEIFALEQIRLIPCRIPPHRQQPNVDGETRLQMLQLAIANRSFMRTDRRELDRDGPSYMVDTLSSLRQEYDYRPILLFIGTDAFAGLKTWCRWQQLFDFAHVVVMTRPGYQHGKLEAFFDERLVEQTEILHSRPSGNLYFQHVTQLDISATAIRELITHGRDPHFLLPDAVIDFIDQHKLYRS